MPEPSYLVAVLAIVFTITLALRALPFAALSAVRDSPLVNSLSAWMPAGILAILAASTLAGTVTADPVRLGIGALAVAITAAVHLLAGRRTLLSVGAGTIVYVVLVNTLG